MTVRFGPSQYDCGAPVDTDQDESDRAARVVDALSDLEVSTTVRTPRAAVADRALDAGAEVVADESGLVDPEMRFVVADHDATLVLGSGYGFGAGVGGCRSGAELVAEIRRTLGNRMRHAVRAGVDRNRIVLEPSAGVRSNPEATLSVLDRLAAFRGLGRPLLVDATHFSTAPGPDSDTAEARLSPQTVIALAAERGVDVVVGDVTDHTHVLRALS